MARRWRLAASFWQARSDLRKAVVARTISQQSVSLAEEELVLRQDFLDWVQTRIRFGAGIGADLLTAQTNLSRAEVQLRTARGDLGTAEAQIAAAIGISVDHVPQVAPIPFDSLPLPDTADFGALRDWGLTNRLTVRAALADYEVAEQALRQTVASQYPDVNLGPGFTYDKGDAGIIVSSSAVVPLLHDQSAAITQAMDVRAKAARQFELVQTQTLAEIETATTRFRAAYTALIETRNSEDLASQTLAEVQRRLAAGSADRGEVLTAELGLSTAQRASLDAVRVATDALGALEDGVQRPIWPASALALKWPDNLIP